MPKDPMKPLTGGTIIMVLLLVAGLLGRLMLSAWEREHAEEERRRAEIAQRIAAAETKRRNQEEHMRKPPFHLEFAAAALQRQAQGGEPYAQAAFAVVLRDAEQNQYQLRHEYQTVGRLLIGPDYDRVMAENRIVGRDCMRSEVASFPDWFRRSALQGNAYGMAGLAQASLSPPGSSGTLKPDYREYAKWTLLAELHADATEQALPPRFAALRRVPRAATKELMAELVANRMLSAAQAAEVEREVREFKPSKQNR
ncbi:MAG: hypothetical protein RJA37_514 [Verrucomicrobiota bacterium]|jgi:hypothetical protein